jgi:hypothetical protein
LSELDSKTQKLLSFSSRQAIVEREEVDEETASNIFTLIKDNEVDHLRQLLTPDLLIRVGFGGLVWNLQDPPVPDFEVSSTLKIQASDFSPVVFAIKSKSLSCLKYLVESGTNKGLREAFQYKSDGWQVEEGIVYSNLALAVIAKIHDLEALNYLLKQTAFVLNSNDLLSFL